MRLSAVYEAITHTHTHLSYKVPCSAFEIQDIMLTAEEYKEGKNRVK